MLERQVLNYSPSFGGFAFSSALRAQAWPYLSTLSFSAGLARMPMNAVSADSGGAGGLPRGRFGFSSMAGSLAHLMFNKKCLHSLI